MAFFYLLRKPIKTVDQSEGQAEMIAQSDESQVEMIGFKNKFTHIPKLFKYMIPLGLAVLFQFFAISFFVWLLKDLLFII